MKEQTVSGSDKNLHSPKLNTRLIEAKKNGGEEKKRGKKKRKVKQPSSAFPTMKILTAKH